MSATCLIEFDMLSPASLDQPCTGMLSRAEYHSSKRCNVVSQTSDVGDPNTK